MPEIRIIPGLAACFSDPVTHIIYDRRHKFLISDHTEKDLEAGVVPHLGKGQNDQRGQGQRREEDPRRKDQDLEREKGPAPGTETGKDLGPGTKIGTEKGQGQEIVTGIGRGQGQEIETGTEKGQGQRREEGKRRKEDLGRGLETEIETEGKLLIRLHV